MAQRRADQHDAATGGVRDGRDRLAGDAAASLAAGGGSALPLGRRQFDRGNRAVPDPGDGAARHEWCIDGARERQCGFAAFRLGDDAFSGGETAVANRHSGSAVAGGGIRHSVLGATIFRCTGLAVPVVGSAVGAPAQVGADGRRGGLVCAGVGVAAAGRLDAAGVGRLATAVRHRLRSVSCL